jgi:hypothetical protein
MVNAKHCCWGTCPSDSRYSEKLPKQGIAKSDGTGMSAVAMCSLLLTADCAGFSPRTFAANHFPPSIHPANDAFPNY